MPRGILPVMGNITGEVSRGVKWQDECVEARIKVYMEDLRNKDGRR